MASLEQDTPRPVAPSVFNDIAFADVIIRSSDGAEYRMSKALLAQSSPVFRDIFSLPQPQTSTSNLGDEEKDGLPVIPLAEPAKVLDVLLQFCIPSAPPSFDPLDIQETLDVLRSAKKYNIDWALSCAREAWSRVAEKDPVRAYAAACRYELKDEARQAALFTLRLPMKSIIHFQGRELQTMTGESLSWLLQYRDHCRKVVPNYISNTAVDISKRSVKMHPIWFGPGSSAFGTGCACRASRVPGRDEQKPFAIVTFGWWDTYINETITDLAESTWEGTIGIEKALSAFLEDGDGACSHCHKNVYGQLDSFTKALSQEVKAKIEVISNEFWDDLQGD